MTAILDSSQTKGDFTKGEFAQDEFTKIASQTISTIIDTIENYDPAGVVQIDIQGDIITLRVLEKQTYVLNKHNASRQIWLASPISGPYHFSYLQNQWISSAGLLLSEVLTTEFGSFVNKIKFCL